LQQPSERDCPNSIHENPTPVRESDSEVGIHKLVAYVKTIP
jgi:hypothetical protein